jgi:hypothetical protein
MFQDGKFGSAIMPFASVVPNGTAVSFDLKPIPAPGRASFMTIAVGLNPSVGTYVGTQAPTGGRRDDVVDLQPRQIEEHSHRPARIH